MKAFNFGMGIAFAACAIATLRGGERLTVGFLLCAGVFVCLGLISFVVEKLEKRRRG